MTVFDMANTIRHIDLVGGFTSAHTGRDRYRLGHRVFSESGALLHKGHRALDISALSLINTDDISNIKDLDYFHYTQPDFFLFSENKYILNYNKTKIAGYPDLIVEVWSDSDSQADKYVKYQIYSHSNNKTEHWYIEQDSNEVICYIGETPLESQSLLRPLETKNGIEFDLTYLSI